MTAAASPAEGPAAQASGGTDSLWHGRPRWLLPPVNPRRAIHTWQFNVTIYKRIWASTILSNLLDPVIYLLALGFGLGAFLTEIEGMTYVAFIAPGLIASSAMMAAMFEVAWNAYIRIHVDHTIDAIIATPSTVEEAVAGELLWAATRATIYASVMVGVLVAFPQVPVTPWAILAIPAAFLGGLAFAVLGLTYTASVKHIDQLTFLFTLFVTPMFLFSGIFFPISGLPVWVQWIAEALPLTHLVDLCRGFVYGQLHAGLWWDVLYLAAIPMLLYGVPMRLVRRHLVK